MSRHERRPALPVEGQSNLGTCPGCGKKCYPSRKVARHAANQLYPGQRVGVYRCEQDDRWFHLTSQSARSSAAWKDYRAQQRSSEAS